MFAGCPKQDKTGNDMAIAFFMVKGNGCVKRQIGESMRFYIEREVPETIQQIGSIKIFPSPCTCNNLYTLEQAKIIFYMRR